MAEYTKIEVSFEDFYKKYFSRLVGYCHAASRLDQADSEDLVQNAFLELYRHWDRLSTHTEPGLLGWMRKAIQLQTKTYFRKKSKEPVTLELYDWLDLESLETAESYRMEDFIAENDQYRQYIDRIPAYLSEKQRKIFECVVIRQTDLKTAAKELNMKENSLKIALKRLKFKIRTEILPLILKP